MEQQAVSDRQADCQYLGGKNTEHRKQVQAIVDALSTQIDIDQPFYIVDLGETERLYRKWRHQFPNILPYYSVKVNTDDKLMGRLASLGTSFDCASVKEMESILSKGIPPDRIIFAHPIKTISSLRYAAQHGVTEMTFDNADELRKIATHYPQARLYLRIYASDPKAHYHLSDKFGASRLSCINLFELARDLRLEVVGVAFHLGCGVTSGDLYVNAMEDAINIIKEGAARGHRITTLDLGGGWSHRNFLEVSQAVRIFLQRDKFLQSNGVRVIAEPGTYFAQSPFTLVCNVIGRRQAPMDKDRPDFLYLDEGVWGSFEEVLFDTIHPQPNLLSSSGTEHKDHKPHSYCLWGPTCDSTDKVIPHWTFEREVVYGDRMFFEDMGAYTTSCATSFNGLHPTRHMVYIDTEQGTEKGEIFVVEESRR